MSDIGSDQLHPWFHALTSVCVCGWQGLMLPVWRQRGAMCPPLEWLQRSCVRMMTWPPASSWTRTLVFRLTKWTQGVFRHGSAVCSLYTISLLSVVFAVSDFLFVCVFALLYCLLLQVSSDKGKTGGAEGAYRALQETWQLGESFQSFDIWRLGP